MKPLSTLAALATLAVAMPALAGGGNALPTDSRVTPADFTGNPVTETINFASPHDVVQIRATTSGQYLKIDTMDCCIPGDVWSIRVIDLSNGRVTDVRAIGNGSNSAATGPVTVYRQGSQDIDALVEIRYAEGVATFPAGMYVNFSTKPSNTVTTTVQATTVPLPSR